MPTFDPCCVAAVENMGAKLCDWDTVCLPIQQQLNFYCKNQGQNPCSPMPQIPGGQICYCCCSCFAYDTPIEMSPNEFVMVQDIVADVDEILAGSYSAGGGAAVWVPRVVDYSGGISAGPGEGELEFDYMYYITYQVEDGSEPPQFMITTVDHLFLRPDGRVTPVQYLVPDDKVVRAHGGLCTVRFVVPARYRGGLHHLSFDGFNNETLDGHLLSANGVVTADYSVQLAYSSGDLNPELLDLPPETNARASERAYQARHASEESIAFVADKTLWPLGMTPVASEPMVNIPSYAKSFLTQAQGEDVQTNAPIIPLDNTMNVTAALWLYKVYGAFFPGPIYLVDWQNDLPNGYTWEVNRQRFILITGGMLRIQKFNQEGLSVVIAHLISVAEGVACVGPADYDAVFAKMRTVWRNEYYFASFTAGFDQVKALFSYVSPEHSGENPADICAQPALDCRLRAMEAASTMFPLPECADPDSYFGVVGALAGRNIRYVSVRFNRPVNLESAQTTDNYTISGGTSSGGVSIEEAQVSRADPSVVRLTTGGLQPSSDYLVTVANVLSEAETPINPAHASADFRTAEAPISGETK
ncbi:MAG: hypothetical protein ABWX67_15680 [Allosphingosinicella sp.]